MVEHIARLPWPGNVRQLASLLKVLLALADDGDVVTLSDLPPTYYSATDIKKRRSLQRTLRRMWTPYYRA
ncbi:Formate hydrogenlyase transcriptional activator [Cronobacter malonaticus 507]|nr:Formate hydrogenlyase transcriptional activator [Cronobacter malonaticus 507]